MTPLPLDFYKTNLENPNSPFISFAWPGGYPVIYHCADGGTVCPDCANGAHGSECAPGDEDPQWNLIGAELYMEGPPLYCDHCSAGVESAYGDPDQEA